MKFQKYMSRAHLNSRNIALYSNGHGHDAELRAENVETDKVLGTIKFSSEDAAEDWYDDIPGTGLGRLDNALEMICE